MIKLRKNMKNKLTFAAAFAFLVCASFVFAAEVLANGNVSADEPVPPAKKSVRRAPIKRAPQKTPAKTVSEPADTGAQNVQSTQVQTQLYQPASLEMGIQMMERERYKQAHDWLQKAVQEERENPYAWYWYGVAHDKVGQYEQAQFFYARALELDPAFPPLSRVLAYPDEGDREALWDPLRPARVYPIELGDRNVMVVPPDAPEATFREPVPYVDPTLPQVPVYVPPDIPSAAGDAAQPPVYMPPNFSEGAPVYSPPEQINTTYIDTQPTDQVTAAPIDDLPPARVIPTPVYIPPPSSLDMTEEPVYTPPLPR